MTSRPLPRGPKADLGAPQSSPIKSVEPVDIGQYKAQPGGASAPVPPANEFEPTRRPTLQNMVEQIQKADGPFKANKAQVDHVIEQESGGDPNAVSRAGAGGLMQIMPKTFAGMGGKDVFDPVENRALGTAYLNQMINQFGSDIELGLMAYNWGPGSVNRWLKGGRRGRIPAETKKYVAKLLPKMLAEEKRKR